MQDIISHLQDSNLGFPNLSLTSTWKCCLAFSLSCSQISTKALAFTINTRGVPTNPPMSTGDSCAKGQFQCRCWSFCASLHPGWQKTHKGQNSLKQDINTGETNKKNGGKQKFANLPPHLVSKPTCYLSEATMVHFRFRLPGSSSSSSINSVKWPNPNLSPKGRKMAEKAGTSTSPEKKQHFAQEYLPPLFFHAFQQV